MRTYEEIADRIKRYEEERGEALRRIPTDTSPGHRQRHYNIAESHRLKLNELYWLVGKRPIPRG